MTMVKTALIGAASAALVVAAAILAGTPAKADAVLGDVKGWRPDPAYAGRSVPRPGHVEPRDRLSRAEPRSRDHFEGRHGWLRPVHASGSVAGDMPVEIKRWRAERIAIAQWRREVTERYGFEFSRWRVARARETTCEVRPAQVVCHIRGVPARFEPRWPRYGGY